MDKGRPPVHWAGFLLALAAILGMCLAAPGGVDPVPSPDTPRPDLIRIDTLAARGRLEMPAVTFFHDRHTDALARENKGCDTCHLKEDGKLALGFKGARAAPLAAIKDIYHANCIGCHQEDVVRGKTSGPLDGFCRDCHNARPPEATRLDAGLGKVLHYRHLASKDIPAMNGGPENCGVCHHDFDEQKKQTFYAKGRESSCRVCHLDKTKDGVMSLGQAAHQQCVLCHLELARQGVQAPLPVRCADCHGAAGQAQAAGRDREVLAGLPHQEVPRLRRGQPDATLIMPAAGSGEGQGAHPGPAALVPFDHLAHEKYNDTCRACHHAGFEACGQCHTLGGARAGGLVTLEQAMHLKSSQFSCVGCHEARQAQAACAGCHRGIVETGQPGKAACNLCHLPSGTAGQTAGLSAEARHALAAKMLRERPPGQGAYPMGDIPEKVVIKELANKYQPVEFKHREHVLALMKGIEDSRLARYFHRDPGTMCQGCHHHSSPSKTPPACVSCHARQVGQASFDPREANRPGLLAAQHGRCMSCHRYMAVKPAATACQQCHQESGSRLGALNEECFHGTTNLSGPAGSGRFERSCGPGSPGRGGQAFPGLSR